MHSNSLKIDGILSSTVYVMDLNFSKIYQFYQLTNKSKGNH